MPGLNYLANALLIDSVDKVINKLLEARNYAVIHKSQIEPRFAAFAAYEAIRALGGANDE